MIESSEAVRLLTNLVEIFGPAIIAFGCGYLAKDPQTEVHDHGVSYGNLTKHLGYIGKKGHSLHYSSGDKYNPAIHGKIVDWVDEGEVLKYPGTDNPWYSNDHTEVAVHRHNGKAASGVHEYNYEPIKET